ncbi:DUF4030 domain-containing protein [Bacillus sp. BGMRC 2118]|nr:DUF4030 domain-containing protein [Bacillus sp. BGMRC 2118]
MENDLKKAKKFFSETYYNSNITTRIKNGVHNRIASEGTKYNFNRRKKALYSFGAAAVVCGLLFASLFVSPTMAEVAAKIPYLNQILHLKPLDEVLVEKLEEKGYQVDGIGMYINEEKEIEIQIKGLNEESKKDVENIVNEQLSLRGYDAYTFNVRESYYHSNQPVELTKDEKLAEGILEEAIGKLEENGYTILMYGFGYSSPSKNIKFRVDIPNTENRIEDIENTFHEIIKGKQIGEYTVNVVTIDLEQEIENKWSKWNTDVFPVIVSGMMGKKEYEVTGFTYSFKPEALEIFLKTSINSTDHNAKDRALKVETTVKEFLESEELKEITSTHPYKIIVRSKDQKQIN